MADSLGDVMLTIRRLLTPFLNQQVPFIKSTRLPLRDRQLKHLLRAMILTLSVRQKLRKSDSKP